MYSIPVIPNDLRHEETIIQAAYALDNLNKTINSIFDKIDKRIETNNVKVKDLHERISKAQLKIQSLIGTKKAIKIYAPSRFPADHIFRDIPATFGDGGFKKDFSEIDECLEKNGNVSGNVYRNKEPLYEVKSRPENLQSLEDKLVYFHVRSSLETSFASTKSINEEIMENSRDLEQSIKKNILEKNLRSVSSILLFGTDDFAYTNANNNNSNNLKNNSWVESTSSSAHSASSVYKSQNERKDKRKEGSPSGSRLYELLDAAPVSLQNRNKHRITPAGELRYMPRSKEAPEIDLPLDLPDLPGIADDIQFDFQIDKDIPIAPSLYGVHLPDLEELEKENASTHNIPKEKRSKEPTRNEINTASNQPPPPPPPLGPSSQDSTVAGVKEQNQVKLQALAAPPPPPPPPPPPMQPPAPQPATSEQLQPPSTQAIKQKPSFAPDPHANLMESIRKAGGTRGGLLKATTDTLDTNVQGKISSPLIKKKYEGNDLMMDLHNKLQMRRKGISGVNSQIKESNTSISPIMDHLSLLIPPPLQPKDLTRRSEDDDENEWTE